MARRLAVGLVENCRGAAAIELALLLPVLLLLLLGTVEVSRYLLLNQKLDRVATTMSDLVAQSQTITRLDLNNLFTACEPIAAPFDLQDNGVVIITSVGAPDGTPVINWQSGGAGGFTVQSSIGQPGAPATLPAGLIVRPGETVIVAEVFYRFTETFTGGLLPALTLYHRAFNRPRLGDLTQLG